VQPQTLHHYVSSNHCDPQPKPSTAN
jgi:hypothetical protein